MADERPERQLEEWTQDELELLHEMVKDYDRARWLRGQLKVWLMWVAGLPALILGVWTAGVELFKLWKGL